MLQKIKEIFSSDSTKAKMARNVVWAVAGKIITMASTLFVGILVARYLGPSQYGAINYAVSIVTLFSVLASFGMSDIVVRELSKTPEKRDVILGTAFIIRIVLAIVTIGIIALYLALGSESESATTLILIYSATILFSSFDVIRCYFTSIIQNEYIVKSEIFRASIAALLQILLLYFKAPLYAFVIVLTFNAMLLASGYITAYLKKVDTLLKWKFDKDMSKYLLKTSFPLLLSLSAVIVYQRIDQVMIGKMLDDTQLGYFSTAMSFVGVLVFIPTMAMQTVTPLLVQYYRDDRVLYESRSQMVISVMTWAMIILSIILSIIAYHVMYYTYGIEYIAAVPVLQILAFKVVGTTLSMTAGQLLIIENIHKYAVIRNIIACVVCVVCNYLFIPRWGIIGSAWATIITVMFQGWVANLFIPPYHKILIKQTKAIFLGLFDCLVYVRR